MHYFILAVSKNHAQLFEVTGDRILPRGVDGMPTSLADAWKGMEREAGDHNQRNANDVTEQEEDQYIHMIAKSLKTIIHEQHDPVVFAGVKEMYGMYKKYDNSEHLLDEYIQGSPDQLSEKDLKDRAEEIVRPHIVKQNEVVLEVFGNLQGTGRTSVDPEEIVDRAEAGKVETLILPLGKEMEFGELSQEVLSHRGSVRSVEPSKMPEGALVAAILRL